MRQIRSLAFSALFAITVPASAFAQCTFVDSDLPGSQPAEQNARQKYSLVTLNQNTSLISLPGAPIRIEQQLSDSSVPPLAGVVTKNANKKKHREALSLKSKVDEFSSDLLAGSTFPIELDAHLSSKDSAVGERVTGHLTSDLKVGSIVMAQKGAAIEGSVSHVIPACSGLKSNKLNRHFRNANGAIQLVFTKLQAPNGGEYDIAAAPAPGFSIQKISAAEQGLVTNNLGEIGVPYHAGRYTALAIAISGSSMAAGPFGMAGAPAVSAVVGALMPAYGLGRPRRPDEKHVRVKSALMGALRGSPGGFLTSGIFVHGLDASVANGDQIVLQLKQNLSVQSHQKDVSSAYLP